MTDTRKTRPPADTYPKPGKYGWHSLHPSDPAIIPLPTIPTYNIVNDAAFRHGGPRHLELLPQWRSLARPLELAGGAAMRPAPEGGLVLTRALASAMPWMAPVASIIEAQLALGMVAGRPWIAVRPLLLVGPPGSGKSHFLRLLASWSGCGFATFDLGGTSDNRILEGTASGFTGAQPCWPLTVIASTLTANAILLLDELDKAGGSDANGRAHATLLAMTEPGSCSAYYDTCLMQAVDLSQLNWVFSANTVETIPKPLLSRLQIVEVPLPSMRDFEIIVAGVRGVMADTMQLRPEDIPDLPPRANTLLRKRFAADRSVRALTQNAQAVLGALLADRGRGGVQ